MIHLDSHREAQHYQLDKFEDSLKRVYADLCGHPFGLAGNYELETLKMLKEAFKESEIVSDYTVASSQEL
jgi:hypothetical protein